MITQQIKYFVLILMYISRNSFASSHVSSPLFTNLSPKLLSPSSLVTTASTNNKRSFQSISRTKLTIVRSLQKEDNDTRDNTDENPLNSFFKQVQSMFDKTKETLKSSTSASSAHENTQRTIEKVIQFSTGGASSATNFFISYLNRKIMPEQEISDDDDDEAIDSKIHEKLGRFSIQVVLAFIAIGTITAILPPISLPGVCKQWDNEIKSWLHHILIKSYIFTTPSSPIVNNIPNHAIVLTVPCQCILFILTSIEPVYAIITETSAMGKYDGQSALSVAGFLYILRKHIFPPRYLFILGAGLRMIQQCTNFKDVFDPSVGVCALVNLGAIFGSAKGISKIVLGWVVTPLAWRIFGAQTPQL